MLVNRKEAGAITRKYVGRWNGEKKHPKQTAPVPKSAPINLPPLH